MCPSVNFCGVVVDNERVSCYARLDHNTHTHLEDTNNNSLTHLLHSNYEATTDILHSYSYYKTQKYIYKGIYKRFLYILPTIYVPICIIWYNVVNNTLDRIYAKNCYFLSRNKPRFLLTFPDNSIFFTGRLVGIVVTYTLR